MKYFIGSYVIFILLVAGCKSSQSSFGSEDTAVSLEELIRGHPILKDHFTGFVLQEVGAEKPIVNINGDLLFTPASNTKILTFYTSLLLHKQRIEALRYKFSGDSLLFWGTGAPNFLGRYDVDSAAIRFLETVDKNLFYHTNIEKLDRFGSGWSWDDFPYDYQKEQSSLPIFDNALRIEKDSLQKISIRPAISSKVTINTQAKNRVYRDEWSDEIIINPNKIDIGRIYEVPFFNTEEYNIELLSEVVNRPIEIIKTQIETPDFQSIISTQLDTLYKGLMIDSDNFVAEQLLLNLVFTDTLWSSKNELIRYVRDSLFLDMPGEMRWVDGSGLSRYNLITPQQLVWILSKLDLTLSEDQIKTYFPSAENEGLDTLFNRPLGHGDEMYPFIYAKTGTLSNNHNLSGYIYTRSGKKISFFIYEQSLFKT